jgi:hypothetical protein
MICLLLIPHTNTLYFERNESVGMERTVIKGDTPNEILLLVQLAALCTHQQQHCLSLAVPLQ